MNLSNYILATIGVAASCGLIAAYFKASAGKANRDLLESNVQAYKDSERLKDQRIVYLESQLYTANENIKRLVNESK